MIDGTMLLAALTHGTLIIIINIISIIMKRLTVTNWMMPSCSKKGFDNEFWLL
jgi:hypothetical protein